MKIFKEMTHLRHCRPGLILASMYEVAIRGNYSLAICLILLTICNYLMEILSEIRSGY